MLDQITPMIITQDEAPNIARALDRLSWAKRILVIDSGSTDGTLAIIARYPKATVVTRAFDTFASQCNHGMSLIESPFVLSMDADYILPPEFVAELAATVPSNAVSGYRNRFYYRIYGRQLHGTIYPPRVTVYRPERAEYADVGHGHKLAIEGRVVDLSTRIDHDDRKSLQRWLSSQGSYVAAEADYLLGIEPAKRNWLERLRLMAWPAPFVSLGYTLIVKGCILDGWPGWFYSLQRAYAEFLLALELVDRKLQRRAVAGGKR